VIEMVEINIHSIKEKGKEENEAQLTIFEG